VRLDAGEERDARARGGAAWQGSGGVSTRLERRRLRSTHLAGELAVVGAFAGLVLALLLGGELAVLVAHGHLAGLPRDGGLGGVVRSLLGRGGVGGPMSEWPADDVAPAAVYWSCTAVAAGLLATAPVVVWRWASGRWQPRRNLVGFATRAQERALTDRGLRRREARVHTRPSMGRVRRCAISEVAYVLGRSARTGRQLHGSFQDHLGLVGLTGAGKSRSFIAPLVAQAPGAAVVTGVQKADVLALTGCLPGRDEPVLVLDPEGVSCWPEPLRFPLLAGCEEPEVAWRRGYHFAAGARPAQGMATVSNHEFFVNEAGIVIGAFFCAAQLGCEGDLGAVWGWGHRFGERQPVEILERHGGDHLAVAAGLEQAYATVGPQRSGVVSQVRQALGCLTNWAVREACSGRASEALNAEAFVRARGRLYVLGRTDSQASIAPVVNVLLDEVITAALRLAARSRGNRLDPPLGLFLDEVHNIARLPRLPEYLATARGSGIWIVWGAQSRAMMREVWGQNGEAAIWQGTPMVVWFGGSKEGQELQDLERLGGDVEEDYWLRRPAGRGELHRYHERRVVKATPVDYLRELPRGRVVLYARETPPIEMRVEDWTRRRELAGAMRESLARFRGLTGLDLT
jgi:type IV secretion system protein VirD4